MDQEILMNKFTSILVAGLFATSLSLSAFAADAAKPAVAETAKTVVTETAKPAVAETAKTVVADTKAKATIAAKKDSGIKTAVKKLAPDAKKTELKIK